MSEVPPSPRDEPPPPTGEPRVPPPPADGSGSDGAGTGEAVPFSVADGLGLVAWTIVAQFLVAGPFLAAGVEVGTSEGFLWVLVLTQLVTFGGALTYLAVRGRLTPELLGADRSRWQRHVLVGLGVGVAGFLIVTLVVAAVNALVGPLEPPEQALLETTTAGGASTVLSVAIAVLLAPLVEELVFRGVLFRALERRTGLWWAVGLSSLVFAAVHLEVVFSQPLFAFALLLLGVWLALALHRTRSLLVPTLGHAVFNGITVTIALLTA